MKLASLILVALTGFVTLAQEPKPAEPEHLADPPTKEEKRDANAQSILGVMVAELRTKAEKGDATAQSDLGAMYADGMAVVKDRKEAVKWFRQAADQGNALAEYNLGVSYADGEGGTKDQAEAVKWYRRAADQGYARAQFNLGGMYANGKGVAKDPTEAAQWYRKAADHGHAKAQFNLGLSYHNGEGVAKDAKEAVKWYRKAAEQGEAHAQFNVGWMYATGIGVAKDPKEAVKWYRKAAEQGHTHAQCNLGVSYENGVGVAKGLKEAVKWYREAAEQGEAVGQSNLGMRYANGEGVAKDLKEAVKWYRKAAEQGYADAQNNLGWMYLTGQGVLKDEIEALAWFNLSAISGDERAIKNRDVGERRLGRQTALVAQQRSKDILKQIEAIQARSGGGVATIPHMQTESRGKPKSTGSGAIVSSSGHILTAAHVIADAAHVNVITVQGTKNATVVCIDESNDLAVLKLSGGDYPALPVAPSDRIRLGQGVATIGFPNIGIQGFSPKLTRGEISSVNGISDDPRSWQISAPVQPGNSGGPLLDEYGNLIGVVLAKLGLEAAKATGDLPQNVGYAVKSAYALALLEPYLNSRAPKPSEPDRKPSFEDMVAKAQQSVVLILVY